MHHNAIVIQNLNYGYADGSRALENISLSIHANERVALIGANGSGKSTVPQAHSQFCRAGLSKS
jgi:cobalt/nickel transport system ATP-binding protein